VVNVDGSNLQKVSPASWFTVGWEGQSSHPGWESADVLRYEVHFDIEDDLDEEGRLRIWDPLTFQAKVELNQFNAPIDQMPKKMERRYEVFTKST